ncbi:hypothetical protein RR48_13239 [Papilio machaon]|uniref:Uncharacterized protein n=1 Tax=Papilio machaon TaxID=76193 RepID=A0A194QXC2_PAPMA|nr:hypothetical protein RR48_13239 [Papilio machaon]
MSVNTIVTAKNPLRHSLGIGSYLVERRTMMSEGEKPLVEKSECSSFEDLASAATPQKIAEKSAETQKDEWHDLSGSGALLKKVMIPKVCGHTEATFAE